MLINDDTGWNDWGVVARTSAIRHRDIDRVAKEGVVL